MDHDKRFHLITRNTGEVLTPEDLKQMIETGVPLKHYIGFEISGKVHLGTGLMSGMKISDFQKANVDCSVYLATWHAWINNKLGGDLEVIRHSSEYFKEGLKAGVEIMGGDVEKLKFVTGDELYHNNDKYWLQTVELAKNLTLNRVLRAVSIMGRKESMDLSVASLLYPPMQVADIFIQGVNIAHAGMDQRKAQVIARELAPKVKISPLIHNKVQYKPIAIHHPLIPGLQKPAKWPVTKEEMQEMLSELKMSKSVKGSAIFLHDTPEEIRACIKNAFCPEGDISYNPVMEWCKLLIFSQEGKVLHIERPEKWGGNLDYYDYATLEKDFVEKKVHPMDLKAGVGEYLVKMLEPARKRFEKPKIRKLKEEMDALTITR